jgi:hypothetical protein
MFPQFFSSRAHPLCFISQFSIIAAASLRATLSARESLMARFRRPNFSWGTPVASLASHPGEAIAFPGASGVS